MKNILLIDYDASSKIPGCRFAIQKFYEQHIMKGILKLNLITVKFNNLPNSEVNFRYMNELIFNNDISLAIGGDHSITYTLSKSIMTNKSLLIIFDAHLDYFPNHTSEICNWNFIEELLDEYEYIIVLGYRNIYHECAKHEKIYLFSSSDLEYNSRYVKESISKLIERTNDIYLSVDMDVVSPAEFDSVSFPIIGGINFTCLLYFIEWIFSVGQILFCDIVEYNPLVGGDSAIMFYQFVTRLLKIQEGNLKDDEK